MFVWSSPLRKVPILIKCGQLYPLVHASPLIVLPGPVWTLWPKGWFLEPCRTCNRSTLQKRKRRKKISGLKSDGANRSLPFNQSTSKSLHVQILGTDSTIFYLRVGKEWLPFEVQLCYILAGFYLCSSNISWMLQNSDRFRYISCPHFPYYTFHTKTYRVQLL